MAFDDNKLSDLEDTMFSADKYGGKNQEKAVEEWHPIRKGQRQPGD
jgi:glycine betaine/proline transport system substrate-binding protein